jgi:Uso1 / p115 like vesicle tethering protein, head region
MSNRNSSGIGNSSNSDDSVVIDAALLLDRFVSASSSDDVSSSLTSILRGLQKGDIAPEDVYNEFEVLSAMLQILQDNKYKDLPVEDSSPTVARIYLELFNISSKNSSRHKNGIATMLQEPSPGRLVETTIDVASDESGGIYARVVCLQLLHAICTISPKVAQPQLLQAPNGLHRLGDLLKSDVPEQVRNEALLLANTVAEWPAAAKVWMFNEVGDVVIDMAIREGGLTGGNVLVLDCLQLLQNMLKHDGALADLVFQSPILAPSLARLLDLRGGITFRNPAPPNSPKVPVVDEDDDLDDLIASGGVARKNKDTKVAKDTPPPIVTPLLTEAEEKVIGAVFDILSTVLENDVVKRTVWKKHAPIASLIWEMALISPPPLGTPYPCAVPSIDLQQRALQITALYFSDATIMDRHAGLDRLLYIVCTGGGRGQHLEDRLKLQQSAIHVIRKTLPSNVANQMLLQVLAPTMMTDVDEQNPSPSQERANASVVQKLLNTAYANLRQDDDDNKDSSNRTGLITGPKPPSVSRKVFLSGSLGGLSLFLTDEATRSILFRITRETEATKDDGDNIQPPTPSLVDAVLECLMMQTESTLDDHFITLHLLRFLMSWMYEAPIVVQAILSSPYASSLSICFMNSKSRQNIAVSALINCVLGMCMEYMGNESLCGGWTISSIMEMISSSKGGGMGKFTSQLEKLKTIDRRVVPWSICSLEWNIWRTWYEQVVLVVRKRVVQELTGGSDKDDPNISTNNDDKELEGEPAMVTTPSKNQKSLQHLLSQQSMEIEDLRDELTKAKLLNLSQGTFLVRLKSLTSFIAKW